MTRGRAALLAVVVIAGLPACTAPRYPAPPPPADPPPAWRSDAGPSAPLQAQWWRAFGDPVLDAWVAEALAHNTDLASAVARVREARAQEDLARSARLPTLDVGVTAGRSRSIDALGTGSTATVEEPVFQAAWEVDLFGRVADQVRAAAAGTRVAERAQDNLGLSVAATAATGYITLRLLDERLRILHDTVASRAESLRLAQRRAGVGYTSDLEWRQAQSEYEATAQQVPAVEAAVARQEDALAFLAGRAPAPSPRGLALSALRPIPVPDALPSQLLRRRPDIAQAEASLAATDAALEAARAQFLPTLQLSATAGRAFSNALPADVNLWSIGASVLAPLFDGGRLEAQAGAAAARRDQAALAYRRAVLAALREADDNLAGLVRLRDQRGHLQAQRDAVAEAVRHATNRYRAGYASYLDQLDAERGLLTAELALAQVVSDELTTRVALAQAMGGGWSGDAP